MNCTLAEYGPQVAPELAPRIMPVGTYMVATATPANLRASMARRMGQVFPELKAAPIDYVWGGFVDISMNRAPDFARLSHRNFPGGKLLRMPSLAIGMAYYQLRDRL